MTQATEAKPGQPSAVPATVRRAPALPPFDAVRLAQCYRDKSYDEMSAILLGVLAHFRNTTYYGWGPRIAYFVNNFAKHFLFYFSQEDYIPNNTDMRRFVDLNPTIANLVAMSDFGTTDAYLNILSGQRRNFAKILALYSPRNRIRLDRAKLFGINARLASRWYFVFLENYKTGVVAKNSWEHMREHLRAMDERLVGINGFVHHGYFGCTYINHEEDGVLKRKVNELFRQWPPTQQTIANSPDKKKIGVFTSMWVPTHSVYRSQQPFLKALAEDYDLTLIELGPRRHNLDASLFKEVRHFQLGGQPDLSAFNPNDFALAYFPDIGMNLESIFLSNLRIAPIQVSNYGHPVSTCGAQIDYWIGGADTEVPARATDYYSERLVLIPGCAQISTRPPYALKHLVPPESPILINCPWTGQKVNHPHLTLLRQAIERCEQPVKFRFFPGAAVNGNGYLAFAREVGDILGGDHVEVFRPLAYQAYMEAMEGGHFAADSYPFGGYNSAVDVLFLRKPLVALQGDRFYNMASSYLLRRMGMPELVATTPAQYVDLIVRMVNDKKFRARMLTAARTADVDQAVLTHDHAAYFKRAIDHLIQKHDKLKADKSRAPIVIG